MVSFTTLSASYAALASDMRRENAAVTRSTGRLSSGNRITQAADDVAGLSVSARMTTHLSGMRSGVVNIAQASSILQIADGALSRADQALQRMQTLSVAASSGILTKAERLYLDIEFQELKNNVQDIIERTTFNEHNIFQGREVTFQEVNKIVSSTAANDFDPLSINDMVAWFDAADEATIQDAGGNAADSGAFSGAVTSWLDKSGNGNHLTQGNAAERPQFDAGVLNGENVVTFDGNNDRLPGLVPTTTDELTTFIVATRTAGGGSREFFFDFGNNGESSRDILGLQGTTPVYYNLPGAGVDFWNFGNNITFGDYDLYGTVTNTSDVSGRVNGSEFLNVNIAPTHDRNPTNAFVLGDDSTSGDELHGSIAEMVAFERALSDMEREQMEGYLAHKYGLQANLPAGHPYALSPPTSIGAGTAETDNIINGEVVASLNLTGGPFTFSILSGNEDGAFEIDTTSGDISIADVNALGTTSRTVSLEVQVNDGTTPVTTTVTLNLLAPIQTRQETSFSFLTGDANGESFTFDIGLIQLTDVFSDPTISITSESEAQDAFNELSASIDFITDRRSYVGSKMSQAGYTGDSLRENIAATSSGRGVITDTNIAHESTQYALIRANLDATINTTAQAQSLHRTLIGEILDEGIQLETLS